MIWKLFNGKVFEMKMKRVKCNASLKTMAYEWLHWKYKASRKVRIAIKYHLFVVLSFLQRWLVCFLLPESFVMKMKSAVGNFFKTRELKNCLVYKSLETLVWKLLQILAKKFWQREDICVGLFAISSCKVLEKNLNWKMWRTSLEAMIKWKVQIPIKDHSRYKRFHLVVWVFFGDGLFVFASRKVFENKRNVL